MAVFLILHLDALKLFFLLFEVYRLGKVKVLRASQFKKSIVRALKLYIFNKYMP